MKNKVVHYRPRNAYKGISWLFAACGYCLWWDDKRTNVRSKVTCGNCRRTKIFRGET